VIALKRGFYVAAEFVYARIADGNSKIAASHVFQLVSFVENDRSGLRENAGIGSVFGLLLDRQIGEEKMVIDDDDVTLRRPAVHFRDEALVEGTAFLAKTRVRARIQFVPEHAGFWKSR
jgi:hypothetical protein